MQAQAIVERLDVLEQATTGLASGAVCTVVHLFSFRELYAAYCRLQRQLTRPAS